MVPELEQDPTTEDSAEESTESTEEPTEPTEDSTEPTEDPKDDGEDVDSLPEWAQRTIKSLRSENGRRRTALREAEERLEKATTADEFESARAEWQSEKSALEDELTRERVLRKVRLPDELAERVKGTTYDEMLEDAEALAALVRKPGRGGKGGLDPSPTRKTSDDDDPIAAARKARSQRRGYNY